MPPTLLHTSHLTSKIYPVFFTFMGLFSFFKSLNRLYLSFQIFSPFLFFLTAGLMAGAVIHQAGKIFQDIHIIDAGVVRRFEGIEILVYISVGEPLGTHVVEMI